MEDSKTSFILILVLLLALGGAVYTKGFSDFSVLPFISSSGDSSSGNVEEAKAKAEDFITGNLVQPGTEFDITDVEKEGNLYKITVGLQGQEIESYMSADYTKFFPSVLDMTEEPADEGAQQEQEQTQDIPKSDNPEVQLFTMSYCPYGNQAEDLMIPVVDLLGNSVTIEPHYIFYENYQGGGPDYCIDDESIYCSMHGVEEANQNLRELCVFNNQQEKYWDFVDNSNQMCTVNDIETCWTEAAEDAAVNTASVESCFNQNALAYAKEEKELTDELGVQGSPTLIINGVKYQGSRSAEGYKTAICEAFNNPPEECEQVLSDTAAAAGGC